MEIVQQSHEVWGQCPTDMTESVAWIERAGRICWATESTGDPISFFRKVVLVRNHGSVAEHSNMVFKIDERNRLRSLFPQIVHVFWFTPYIQVMECEGSVYAYGNLRSWIEWMRAGGLDLNNLNILEFPEQVVTRIQKQIYAITLRKDIVTCINEKEQIPFSIRRYTVWIETDRAVLAEITRHRNDTAFSVRSQRFCDESNLRVIHPEWLLGTDKTAGNAIFVKAMQQAEKNYNDLRAAGLRKEQARVVLPNQTATTLAMSAYKDQWLTIFKLRTAKSAYTPIRQLTSGIQASLAELPEWV